MAQSIERWKNIESEALASNFVRTGDTEIVAAVSKIVLCFLSAEYDSEMIANSKAKILEDLGLTITSASVTLPLL